MHGPVVRALASHQCGPGSNPGVDAICGSSLLLVLSLAPRGFSPGTPVFFSPQKPTLQKSNSIWNARTRLNEFIRTPKNFVGKQITICSFYNQRETNRRTSYKKKSSVKKDQYTVQTGSTCGPWVLLFVSVIVLVEKIRRVI